MSGFFFFFLKARMFKAAFHNGVSFTRVFKCENIRGWFQAKKKRKKKVIYF